MKHVIIAIAVFSTLSWAAIANTRTNFEGDVRTGSQLCSELEVEVTISATRGLLTHREAGAIVERCYSLYGGSK